MKKQFYIILSFLLMGSTILTAQSNLRGAILDDFSEGLPGAHVYLEGTNYSDLTDINGSYKIFNIPAGTYQLVVSYIGYGNQTTEVTIGNENTLLQNVTMAQSNILSEVVINGRLEGQAKALNNQKNRLNISNIIASEQIERFPDANIGDALKRVSGINVQYDQGEARFANIRGTAPELNSITINGERIPSAEAEKRYVQLDLIPADMVSTIEVNKAVTPDMDGDAIGGSINLVTKKAPAGASIQGTLGTGYSFLTKKPIIKGRLTYSNRFAKDKLGLIVSASILDKSVRSDNVETEWDYLDENDKDGSVYPTDHQVRKYSLQRIRQSYSATLDYNINESHNIYLTGMYNWRNDWENRYRRRYKDIEQLEDGSYVAEIRRQTKGGVKDNNYGRLEDQRMQSVGLGGTHFFNKIKVTWSASALKASEDRPNERYISMNVKDQPVSLDLIDLETPIVTPINGEGMDLSAAYGLNEITEEFQYTDEQDLNGKLDVEIPILFGKNSSFLKVGGRFKNKSKTRDNSFREYTPLDEDAFVMDALRNTESETESDFSIGDYEIGSFVSKEFLGDTDFTKGFEGEDVLEEFAGNFDAEEDVTAAYVMYTQNLGKKMTMVAGVRYEQTKVSYSGKIFDGETLTGSEGESDDYANVLPGLHIKYNLSKWTNLRLAWTNTLARPNYFDLVPYQQINTEDNEISIGNPALEATTSMNVDILLEHYFKNIGLISGGLFYKNLTNVIATKTQNDVNFQGTTYEQFRQPVNAGDADLFGFEIGLQRRLDFLPGALGNFTVYTNYTYNQSKLKDVKLEGREEEDLPLVGTPKNLFNLSLAYDLKKLDLRLSYNFADSFIEEYNDEAFYDGTMSLIISTLMRTML
jgi:TonB-dependent receptor